MLVDRAVLLRGGRYIHAGRELFELFKRRLGGSGMA
jgi:hypothetical protein